jgi:hypothetical protein
MLQIMWRYAGCSGVQAHALGQRRFRVAMPKMNTSPKAIRAGRSRGEGNCELIASSFGNTAGYVIESPRSVERAG